MMKTTVMRLLRIKYGISARELAEAAGVSQQYISGLELGKYRKRHSSRVGGDPVICRAFEEIAANRLAQARRLADDIADNRRRLLDSVEGCHEL